MLHLLALALAPKQLEKGYANNVFTSFFSEVFVEGTGDTVVVAGYILSPLPVS